MTDWDLLTPGIGLTSIGIVGVGISLAGIAKTFIDGMHAVSLLTMFIGMIFLASGLFKDGFPMSGKAKSATFITLGFLVTFGVAAAVTVSAQVPSIFAYIGIMILIAVPAAVISVASFRGTQHLRAIAIIFIAGTIVGAGTFYAFGLVTPKPPSPPEEAPAEEVPAEEEKPAANVVKASILPGASSELNPDYEPEEMNVPKGSVIEWTNNDNAFHTVTSFADDGKSFDSSTIAKAKTFQLDTSKLEEKEYEYYCTLHPFMKAKFTVTAAGSAEQAPGQAGANQTIPEGTTNETGSTESNATTTEPTTPQPSAGSGATVSTVSIASGSSLATNEEFFVPETIETSVGSMVTWKNDDFTFHTVTQGNPDTPEEERAFDSGVVAKGASFSYLFDKAGTFDYFCALHPFMTGKVVVK